MHKTTEMVYMSNVDSQIFHYNCGLYDIENNFENILYAYMWLKKFDCEPLISVFVGQCPSDVMSSIGPTNLDFERYYGKMTLLKKVWAGNFVLFVYISTN